MRSMVFTFYLQDWNKRVGERSEHPRQLHDQIKSKCPRKGTFYLQDWNKRQGLCFIPSFLIGHTVKNNISVYLNNLQRLRHS